MIVIIEFTPPFVKFLKHFMWWKPIRFALLRQFYVWRMRKAKYKGYVTPPVQFCLPPIMPGWIQRINYWCNRQWAVCWFTYLQNEEEK